MDLENLIKQAAVAYYAGDPIMSDADFDALVDQLPPDHPLRNTPGWGGSELTASQKKVTVKHAMFIGGLNKSKWDNEIPTSSTTITPKLDGITGVAYYDTRGELMYVVTRGDGDEGLVVHQGRSLVPTSFEPDAIVRGEIVILKEDWDELLSLTDYKHPRNAVAGIVNSQGDSPYNDFLTFIAYERLDRAERSQGERLSALASRGFKVVNYYFLHVPNLFDNNNLIEGLPWKAVGNNLTAVVDGSVWYDEKSGERKAFKYENASAVTTVKHIEWTRSSRGRINGVIVFDPVHLDGAEISRCTAHNCRFLVDNGIGPGAIVTTRRPEPPRNSLRMGRQWCSPHVNRLPHNR